jgi:basic membrane lipoprotein Med (substrate-binding protein (PBP1-ABC) superfamily)
MKKGQKRTGSNKRWLWDWDQDQYVDAKTGKACAVKKITAKEALQGIKTMHFTSVDPSIDSAITKFFRNPKKDIVLFHDGAIWLGVEVDGVVFGPSEWANVDWEDPENNHDTLQGD